MNSTHSSISASDILFVLFVLGQFFFTNKHLEKTTPENLLSEVFVKHTALQDFYFTTLAKNHIVLNKAKWGKISKHIHLLDVCPEVCHLDFSQHVSY